MNREQTSRWVIPLLGVVALVQALAGPALADHGLPDPVSPPNPTPWPKFHADMRNTAQSTHLGPLAPTLKWTYQGTDRILASPAIGTDGTVYTARSWSACGIEPVGGTQAWCKQLSADVSQSSPAVDKDGTIYLGARDNRLWALDPSNLGNAKWYILLSSEGDIRSSPNIAPDGTIYFAFGGLGGNFGVMASVNPDGGPNSGGNTPQRVNWTVTVGSPIVSSPAITPDGSRIYIASKDGMLHAFKPDSSFAWPSVKAGGALSFSSPAIADNGTIYIGTDTGLRSVNPNGTLSWMFTGVPGSMFGDSSPAIASDGTIYVGSKAGKNKMFYAINPDGTLKWQFGPVQVEADQASFQAIGADGIVYVGLGRWVYAFYADGSMLWQTQIGGTVTASLAIGGTATIATGGEGVLYVASGDHKVYAFATARTGGPVNHPPVANAGPDQVVNEGQQVTFNGGGSSDPDPGTTLTYSWNFGDGNADTGQIVDHTYATPGVYIATLTVSDGQLNASDTVKITVGSPTFTDQFNRADSTDLGPDWDEEQGDLQILGNQLANTPTKGNHLAVCTTLNGANQSASAYFTSVDNSVAGRWGVILRYQAPLTYYLLHRRMGPFNGLVVSKVVNGVETTLAMISYAKPLLNTPFKLTGHAIGSTLTIDIDDVPKLSVTDSTFASGKPGIFLYTSGSPLHRADNYSAEIQ